MLFSEPWLVTAKQFGFIKMCQIFMLVFLKWLWENRQDRYWPIVRWIGALSRLKARKGENKTGTEESARHPEDAEIVNDTHRHIDICSLLQNRRLTEQHKTREVAGAWRQPLTTGTQSGTRARLHENGSNRFWLGLAAFGQYTERTQVVQTSAYCSRIIVMITVVLLLIF